MGSVGNAFSSVKKGFNGLSPLDIISLATATPWSAAADPLRPLNKLMDLAMPQNDIDQPSAPPKAPTILTDDTAATEATEKRKKTGRILTQSRTPGALSDANVYKPTLLGG